MRLLLKTDKGDWLQQEDSMAMRRMSLWLSEGMADALAMDVFEQEQFAHYSPLIIVTVRIVFPACGESSGSWRSIHARAATSLYCSAGEMIRLLHYAQPLN